MSATDATTTDSQFITVKFNLDKMKDALKQQSVPLFVGIGASFFFTIVFVIMAIVFKRFSSTNWLIALAFAVLLLVFILLYVDTAKRKNKVETQLMNARTNLYASAAQLECPAYFTHGYNKGTSKFECRNTNNIGEFVTADNKQHVVYNDTIDINSTDKLYPYEPAYTTPSTPST
jgi:Ca2+/Na+ antiporter